MKQTRWDRAVDPNGDLPEAERFLRAEALRAAFYIAQGLKARQRNHRSGAPEDGSVANAIDAITRQQALRRAEERRLRGRIGGLIARSKHDPRETTIKARSAWEERFEVEVDPEGALPMEERLRRADAARRALYARLALKSLDAHERRARRSGRFTAEQGVRYAATRRQLAGRIGAYTRLASNDPATMTHEARLRSSARFETLVDPDGAMDADQREALVRAAKTEYFRELSKRRVTARRE